MLKSFIITFVFVWLVVGLISLTEQALYVSASVSIEQLEEN